MTLNIWALQLNFFMVSMIRSGDQVKATLSLIKVILSNVKDFFMAPQGNLAW